MSFLPGSRHHGNVARIPAITTARFRPGVANEWDVGFDIVEDPRFIITVLSLEEYDGETGRHGFELLLGRWGRGMVASPPDDRRAA